MYASQVEEQTLTFAVSGMLWKRSLVMVDSETKTLWSHLLGKAMRGKLNFIKGLKVIKILHQFIAAMAIDHTVVEQED